MKPSRNALLLAAFLPLGASFAVLHFADVGRRVWIMHLLLICAADLVAAAGQLLDRWMRGDMPAKAIALTTVPCLTATLLSGAPEPHRWISAGPVSLYMAPLLLPSFLAACSTLLQSGRAAKASVFLVLIAASILLAIQPDASQALALFTGTVILLVCCRAGSAVSVSVLFAIALATACAFVRPDPLEPVPHVEGVFALSLEHSLCAGLAVILSAVALIASLSVYALRGPAWPAATAGYYAVLFCCSVAGLTPAPLIGFGAGPLLGFGLMTAVSPWMGSEKPPGKSSECTPLRGVA